MTRLNWPVLAEEWARGTLRDPMQHFRTRTKRSCPCCGYAGNFVSARKRGPVDHRCPNCKSRPRDRQIAIWFKANGISFNGKKILHIAPEWPLFRKLEKEPGYVGGDIQKRRHSNATVDITKIAFPDNTFDIVICNHVLEHVPDDATAMRETFRVMKPGGQGIFTVPISTEAKTWEPSPGMSVAEVERICGWDHKRYYGRDFSAKLAAAGYAVTTFEASEADRVTYAIAVETVFIARK